MLLGPSQKNPDQIDDEIDHLVKYLGECGIKITISTLIPLKYSAISIVLMTAVMNQVWAKRMYYVHIVLMSVFWVCCVFQPRGENIYSFLFFSAVFMFNAYNSHKEYVHATKEIEEVSLLIHELYVEEKAWRESQTDPVD